MEGKFILNYRISSAHPKAVTSKGAIHIIIDPEKFGTKSRDIKDVLTGEELHIEINFQKDEAYINGVRVKRQRMWENNDRVWVFSPIDNPSKQYHLSSGQIQQMKNN